MKYKTDNLLLYKRSTCPFCQLIDIYVEENNLTIPQINLDDMPNEKEELIKKTGKGQVPCLMINGSPLFESQKILKWLQENL